MVDRHTTFKKNIWLGVCAWSLTAACALLLALIFFRPHHILVELHPQGLSFLNSLAVVNYMFLFMLLVFLIPFVFIFIIFRKPLEIFQAQLFLFWTLISLGFFGFIYADKITKAASRNLLLPPFYILLPVTILLIYKWIYRTKNLQKLILATTSGVIILSASGVLFNFRVWLLPFLIKKYILLGLNISAIVGLVIILGWSCLYRLSLWIINKIIYFTGNKRTFFYKKALAILLVTSCAVAILGYLWENRENYKNVVSRTAKDTNVILIIIDALRPDHLGCYGYARQTSPTIDALAREGVLFRHCYAQAYCTKPSVASILTSLYPPMHGVILDNHALPESLTTLAEMLRANGFITYACVANPLAAAKYNYDQGYDFFEDDLTPGKGKLYYTVFRLFDDIVFKFIRSVNMNFPHPRPDKNKLVNRKVISWLAKFRHKHFFMLIHYLDPHHPYDPPDPYDKIFSYPAGNETLQNISMYDGEIRFVNEYLGELFKKLKSWRIYDNTLIIITADHGEAFGERGYYQHKNLYQEVIKVPLIIKLNHSLPQGKVIESQVRGIDIMPTILDILGISYSGNLEGKSLLPLIKNDEEVKLCDYIFAERDDGDRLSRGIIKDNTWKLILKSDKSGLEDAIREGQIELYNLKTDPGESRNLVTEQPQVLNELLQELERYIKYCETKAVSPVEVESDSETTRRLKSLGYVQ